MRQVARRYEDDDYVYEDVVHTLKTPKRPCGLLWGDERHTTTLHEVEVGHRCHLEEGHAGEHWCWCGPKDDA